jgi:hypothetical protein
VVLSIRCIQLCPAELPRKPTYPAEQVTHYLLLFLALIPTIIRVAQSHR